MRRFQSALFAFALVAAFPTIVKAQFAPGAGTPSVSGSGSAVTTAPATIIPAPTDGTRLYIGSAQCGRTDAGTSAMYVTFNDAAKTVMILPNTGGGGGNNQQYVPALVVPVGSPFAFTESASTSVVMCNAQGYKLP